MTWTQVLVLKTELEGRLALDVLRLEQVGPDRWDVIAAGNGSNVYRITDLDHWHRALIGARVPGITPAEAVGAMEMEEVS